MDFKRGGFRVFFSLKGNPTDNEPNPRASRASFQLCHLDAFTETPLKRRLSCNMRRRHKANTSR
jgi:hypothetical protein